MVEKPPPKVTSSGKERENRGSLPDIEIDINGKQNLGLSELCSDGHYMKEFGSEYVEYLSSATSKVI
jgi:hypothetical protein